MIATERFGGMIQSVVETINPKKAIGSTDIIATDFSSRNDKSKKSHRLGRFDSYKTVRRYDSIRIISKTCQRYKYHLICSKKFLSSNFHGLNRYDERFRVCNFVLFQRPSHGLNRNGESFRGYNFVLFQRSTD
jgi:hypothetical protein